MKFAARFRVDEMQPATVMDLDADWLQVLVLSKTFVSGIIGSATTIFLPAGAKEGTRSYVATERIRGSIEGGDEGEIIVQHAGLEWDAEGWFGQIVPGTGTGPFVNWSGSAQIIHDDEGPYFEFNLPDD